MTMKIRTSLGVLAVVALAATTVALSPLGANLDRHDPGLDDGKFRAGVSAELAAANAGAAAAALETAEVPVGVPCTEGFAGPYPCSNVDLLSVVPLAELGGAAGNDSWGWTDPETGAEIAIMGTGVGTAFIDVTEPTSPVVLGFLQSEEGAVDTPEGSQSTPTDDGALWRDMKVDNDHVYVVSENAGHGMQVFDLTRLRDLGADPTRRFEPDAVYEEFGSAHNIAVNEDTDFAYAVGSDTCSGGLHMIDVSSPTAPEFAGCFDEDGYTHDVQCVVYAGPDADHNGTMPGTEPHEICFASNEDTVAIVDVTDKSNPVLLSQTRYRTVGYTHQGWLTPDQHWFVFNDETDESGNNVGATVTYMVNVEDLDTDKNDGDVKRYVHPTQSVDHNLYITGDLIWEANYNAGLRVLRHTDQALQTGQLQEVAFFDVDPGLDVNQYGGAWNVYPFFESGTIIVSTLDEGLFVLELTVE